MEISLLEGSLPDGSPSYFVQFVDGSNIIRLETVDSSDALVLEALLSHFCLSVQVFTVSPSLMEAA